MIFSDPRRVARLVLALVLLGCGDYPRNSPFDPGVPVQLRIEGPDTLSAVGQSIQLTLRTDPPYRHETPDWHATNLRGPAQVSIDPSGRLTITSDPSIPDAWPVGARQEIAVTAELGGGRRASTLVYFIHRAVGLHADDCAGNRTITLDSLHRTASLCASYVDPRGVLFERTAVDPLYATARDNSIIAFSVNYFSPYLGHANYTLERRKVGSTWIELRTSFEIGRASCRERV